MASSLRTGIAAALKVNPEQESIMVLVCDQPMLDSEIPKPVRDPLLKATDHYRIKIWRNSWSSRDL
jgi:hypothetical protein